ncbi:MAG: hypothetical protein ACFFBD_13605 [Candidatus Hodarchaeota archaeon]
MPLIPKEIKNEIKKRLQALYNTDPRPVKVILEELHQEFNVSIRTLYSLVQGLVKEGKLVLRQARVPDSRKLRRSIVIAYLQEHSATAAAKKLGLSTIRVLDILKNIGFTLPDSATSTRLKKHFRGEHYIPISGELEEIIDGCLLGDFYLDYNSDSTTLSNPEIPIEICLLEYKNAIDTPHRLLSKLSKNTKLRYTDVIKEYNKAVDVISKTPLSSLETHKSYLEAPWLHLLAKKLESYRYSVNFTPGKNRSTIYMQTRATVNLAYQRWRWYRNGSKQLPQDIKISPLSLLYGHHGDGSTNKWLITLCMQSFTYQENEFLAKCLAKIGIRAKPYKIKSQHTGEFLYILRITGHSNIQKYLAYLERAPSELLTLSKQIYPWKYDIHLRKRDVFRPKTKYINQRYFQQFLELLKQSGIDLHQNEPLKRLIPWKF